MSSHNARAQLEAKARRHATAAGLRFAKSRRSPGWPYEFRYLVLERDNVLVDAANDDRLQDLVTRLKGRAKRQ